jgi:hypothetical protein
VATGDGEAIRLALGVDAGKLGAPPVMMRAPKGAVVFGDPSGMVDSALAVAHRRLGFRLLRVKIRHRTCTIYWAFCTES